MAARDAGAGSVVWVGDLGARVTQEALRDAFRQFGDVAEARLVRDGFSARATGCGWVRFRDAESAADVVQRCNVTALYIIAGSPRPVLLGRSLADVMLGCWEDELGAAAAQAGLAQGGAGGAGPRYELVKNDAPESRKGKQQAKLRALLEQHRTDRDCFLEACAEEQTRLFEQHKAAVQSEKSKLKRMEDMTKLCPDLGLRRR